MTLIQLIIECTHMALSSVPIWRIITSGSGNIDSSQNTKGSALHHKSFLKFDGIASSYVKLNSDHFIPNDFFIKHLFIEISTHP